MCCQKLCALHEDEVASIMTARGFESLRAELNSVTLSVLILDATNGGLRLRISVLNDNSTTGT